MARVLISHISPMPNKITGISIYTWKMVEALSKFGKNNYILNTNWDLDKIPQNILNLGIEINHYNPPKNEAASILYNTFFIPNLARRYACDVIYFPQPASMLRAFDRSVVVIHDLYRMTHSSLFSPAQRFQWQWFTSRGFRNAAAVMSVSHATAVEIARFYPDIVDRTYVVHEASPIEPDASVRSEEVSEPYGLFVANITPNKNIGVVIKALKLLRQRFPDFKLIIVGRDEVGLLRSHLSEVGIEATHLSNVSEHDLSNLYRSALFYINSSLTEGFCLPILEAQSFSLPVICSDIPVLREVAGDAAAFFNPNDHAALAEIMAQLLLNQDCVQDMRLRSIKNVKRFSWERAAVEAEVVFEKVMAGRA